MTPLPPITEQHRATVFKQALTIANEQLKTHDLCVRFLAQWPPKPGVPVNPDAFDARPDIELEMRVKKEWVPIDIVYMRQLPIEPERLRSPQELALAIYEKAKQHFAAMSDPKILITPTGSKYDTNGLKQGEFSIDEQGYIRVSGMRVLYPRGDQLRPVKAIDSHSHGIHRFWTLPDNTLVMGDPFDKFRTDNRSGIYLLRQKPLDVPLARIADERKEDAGNYQGKYVVIARNLEGVKRYLADPGSYLQDPGSYIPKN